MNLGHNCDTAVEKLENSANVQVSPSLPSEKFYICSVEYFCQLAMTLRKSAQSLFKYLSPKGACHHPPKNKRYSFLLLTLPSILMQPVLT